MRLFYRERNLTHHECNLLLRLPMRDHIIGQRMPLDVLHRDVMRTFVLANVVNCTNIRVCDCCGRARFAIKTLNYLVTRALGKLRYFYGHETIECFISG